MARKKSYLLSELLDNSRGIRWSEDIEEYLAKKRQEESERQKLMGLQEKLFGNAETVDRLKEVSDKRNRLQSAGVNPDDRPWYEDLGISTLDILTRVGAPLSMLPIFFNRILDTRDKNKNLPWAIKQTLKDEYNLMRYGLKADPETFKSLDTNRLARFAGIAADKDIEKYSKEHPYLSFATDFLGNVLLSGGSGAVLKALNPVKVGRKAITQVAEQVAKEVPLDETVKATRIVGYLPEKGGITKDMAEAYVDELFKDRARFARPISGYLPAPGQTTKTKISADDLDNYLGSYKQRILEDPEMFNKVKRGFIEERFNKFAADPTPLIKAYSDHPMVDKLKNQIADEIVTGKRFAPEIQLKERPAITGYLPAPKPETVVLERPGFQQYLKDLSENLKSKNMVDPAVPIQGNVVTLSNGIRINFKNAQNPLAQLLSKMQPDNQFVVDEAAKVAAGFKDVPKQYKTAVHVFPENYITPVKRPVRWVENNPPQETVQNVIPDPLNFDKVLPDREAAIEYAANLIDKGKAGLDSKNPFVRAILQDYIKRFANQLDEDKAKVAAELLERERYRIASGLGDIPEELRPRTSTWAGPVKAPARQAKNLVDDIDLAKQEYVDRLLKGEGQIPEDFIRRYLNQYQVPESAFNAGSIPKKTKPVYEIIYRPQEIHKGVEVFGKELIKHDQLSKGAQALLNALDKVKLGRGKTLADAGYYFSRRFAKNLQEAPLANDFVNSMDKAGRYFRSTHDKRISTIKDFLQEHGRNIDNDTARILGVLAELPENEWTNGTIKYVTDLMLKQGLIKEAKEIPGELLLKTRDFAKNIMQNIAEQENSVGILDKLRKDYVISHLVRPKQKNFAFMADMMDDYGKGLFADDAAILGAPSHGFVKERHFNRLLDVLKANEGAYKEAIQKGLSHEEALAAMPFEIKDTDIFKILGIRSEASRKAATNKAIIDHITANADLFSVAPKPDWQKVRFRGGIEGYIPDWLLKRLTIDFAEQPTVFRALDRVTSPWKSLVTSLRPDFVFRNALDNAFKTGLLGEVTPKNFKDVFTKVYDKPLLIKDFTLTPDGKWKYTPGSEQVVKGLTQQQLRELEDYVGINFTGFYGRRGDVIQDTEQYINTLHSNKLNPITLAKKLALKAQKTNEQVENFFKRAQFFKELEKYSGDVDKAAEAANKLLFDYGDITGFERNILRPIFPFYTFRRKNIPLMLKTGITQPSKLVSLNNAAQVAKQYNDPIPDEMKPEYLQHAFAIPEGNGKYFTPGLSITDPDAVLPFSDQPLGYPMLNPAIQMLIAGMTGKTAMGDDLEAKSGYGYKAIPPVFAKILSQLGADVREINGKPVIPVKEAYLVNMLTPGIIGQLGQIQSPKDIGKLGSASIFKELDPDLAAQIYISNEKQRLDDLLSTNKVTGKYIPTKEDYEMLGLDINNLPVNLPKPLQEALKKVQKGRN